MYQCLGALPKFSLHHLSKETAQMGLSHLFHPLHYLPQDLPLLPCLLYLDPLQGSQPHHLFPFTDPQLTTCAYIHGGTPISSIEAGHSSVSHQKSAPDVPHILPLEWLIIVVDSSGSSATLVFVHFRGDVLNTNKPFLDCWYPLLSLACQL